MQSLATGLDEDYRKPKNLADQVVRLLDDDSVRSPDRLRLIMEYILYRDGVFPSDTQKLIAHAGLPTQDSEVIQNLELLGARVEKPMKDTKPTPQPLFGRKQAPSQGEEDLSLSRFDPAMKPMLEEVIRSSLDQSIFPFTKPQLDATDNLATQDNISQASLRSAKPTWARTRPSAMEPRQRIIVFMAGGATYSESKACYDVSQTSMKDVFLATTHMITPSLFLRQVGDLSVDRRRLHLPADRPKPKAPAHLFEKEPQPGSGPAAQRPGGLPAPPQPPTAAINSMNIGSNGAVNGSAGKHQLPTPPTIEQPANPGKLVKKDKEKEAKEKKKHHFFSSSKK